MQLLVQRQTREHFGYLRVLDLLRLIGICLGGELLGLGVCRQHGTDIAAVIYHISAPVRTRLRRTAFRLAAKKSNELSDNGKMVLFNHSDALDHTAYVFM